MQRHIPETMVEILHVYLQNERKQNMVQVDN